MIEVNALTKRYRGKTVVDDVTFRCDPGTITGFLGPNGAGKSTTLKMICGLVLPSSGTSMVLGHRYTEFGNPGAVVGTLLDSGALTSSRSGKTTLRLATELIGGSKAREGELLNLVGLDRRAARRHVEKYSLGMRQRLGIAQALIGDPQVLILDEPANGLDPQGIRWMRELLRAFADRGGTVLLSSHLLSEVELIADRLAIINHGKLAAVGPTAELLAGGGGPRTIVRAADQQQDSQLRAELERQALTVDPNHGDQGLLVHAAPLAVGTAALAAGVTLVELHEATHSGQLEDLFLQLTSDPAAPAVVTPPMNAAQ